jgi:DNA-binding CsgD family transcriptional regulator
MLIGRNVESARLAAALASARSGAGGALLLVGEPGIGKTTLVRELIAAAGEMEVLETAGVESEAELPYAALADVLMPLLQHLDALPEVQALALSSALALGPPGAVDRFAVGVATLGLIAEAAEQGPALIVVDDLQWVDSASRDALSFAARRLASIPVVLVAAQRVGSAPMPGAEVIPVGPLGREDAAAVLVDATASIAPQVVARLLDAARGNPLALVELPRLLTRAQLDGTDALADPIPTANGLERAFAAQLAPLSGAGRRASVVAAADSSGTAGVVLTALAALGLDANALHEVEALGLLRIEANKLEFRHPLVRSAAYHGADPTERRIVHGALGGADDDPDRRAWHRAAAAVGPDETIAAELEGAGERARGRAAAGPAAAALERAAALTPEREARGRRLMKAADALEETGNFDRSEALTVEAEALIGDPLVRARLVAQTAGLKMSTGQVEAAHAILLDEAERVAEADPAWAAAMLALAANLPCYRLEAPETLVLAERASALGAPARTRMFHERAALAIGKTMSGDTEGALLALELAREISGSHPNHKQSSAISWPLIWAEEYDAVRALLTWSIGVQREGGALRYLPQSLHPHAELDFRVGRWVPALAEVHEAISLFEETGQTTEGGFACATAARIEAALGHDAESREHAREAFASDDASGLLIATAYASAALGLLELGRGDAEAAIAALAPVERIVRNGSIDEPWLVHWAPDLIEACSRTGDVPRATAELDAFERQARSTKRFSALAAAARCRGILASDEGYDDAFSAALGFHERVPTPFERARTELAWGERLRRSGRRTDARAQLTRALQVFDRLGASPWADRARGELRASGQSVLRPKVRAEDALTPQELQVAAIVAGGATNREAAASLFLSIKTIEFHLGHVYRKLGIRSRTELVRALDAPA